MRANHASGFGRGLVRAAAGFAALVLLAAHPSGLGAQAGGDQALQHAVSVTVKLVQVYATGKGGVPVTDLTAEDFEVIDNGKAQPVTHFEKHFLDVEETPEAAARVLPTNRKFFLLFDFAFMDARGILKAKNAGLKFLSAEIRPTDEIGLITYSASRGLVIHEYLTTEHERIRTMIDGFGLRRYTGRAENLTNFVYQAELSEERPARDDSGAGIQTSNEEEFFTNQARLQTGQRVDDGRRQTYIDQAREMIQALNILAKGLRLAPGFKNIIFFSGGIARQLIYGKTGGAVVGAWSTPEQLAQQLGDYDAAQADSGLRDEFTAMLKEFKASNSPVYAVDVSRAQKEVDASIQEGPGPALREIDGADSLRQFASGTGGKFFANTVDAGVIAADIQKITGAYYVLGFSVDEKWDGKFHKVKVRVKRKGVNIDAQGGYFNPRPFAEFTRFEKLLHVVDVALSEVPQLQIPYEIPVAAMPLQVKGWLQLMAFGRASRGVHTEVLSGKTEAYLMLLDEKNDIASIKRFVLAIPETGKETVFPVFLVAVKPGTYDCRLVIRNMATGRAARGAVSVVIPAQAGAALALDPPLLLGPDMGSLDLATSPEGSLAALFGYDPGAYAPLLGDVPAGTAKIYAALRLSGGPPPGTVEITATLAEEAAAAETNLPVSVLKQQADGATAVYFVELAAGDLKPGRYKVTINVKDAASGASATSSAPFSVK